ncbi:MAG: winged helix-turn-helix domain-containing protein [Myxococcales bacterium]|nr:winged helix-turn-helix domain-containing protein [Myxococcales bacterium]
MTFRDAAAAVLRERGPMHYRDLAEEIVMRHLVHTDGKTPAASLNAVIAVDIDRGPVRRAVRAPSGSLSAGYGVAPWGSMNCSEIIVRAR